MRHSSLLSGQRGLGLIEVLIAVFVLAFGILALASLQMASIRAAAESRARTAGTFLAQEKLEELRSFATLVADADDDGAVDLVVDTDGDGIADATAPAFDQIASGSDTLDEITGGATGFNFTRSWTAVPCRIENDGATTCDADLGANEINFMRLAVRVAWDSVEGDEGELGEVVIEDSLGATSPMDAAVALSSPTRSRESPVVYIQPGFIQNTIPIAIGMDREVAATDPEPTIIRDNVVRTQFEVLTVSNLENGDIRAERSFDYTVVGCNCRMDGVVSGGESQGLSTWNGLTFTRPKQYTNGLNASRTSATALNRNNDPPLVKDLCTTCCRDHHDSHDSSQPKTNPFRPASDYLPNGNHQHYLPQLQDGEYVMIPANTVGDEYYESCRFIRRDGMYTLTTDAHLVNLVAMPETQLDESGERAAYASFASRFVDSYVDLAVRGDSGYPFLEADQIDAIYDATLAEMTTDARRMFEPQQPIAISSNGMQMTSRGIYIDYMSPDVLRAIRCKQSGDISSPACLPYTGRTELELVPFFAVALTQLNTWRSENADVASVPLLDPRDPFSRGFVNPEGNGQTSIIAESAVGNIGLTNHRPERPLHVDAFIDDAIPVEVNGETSPPASSFRVNFSLTATQSTELSHPSVAQFSGIGGPTCSPTGTQGPRAFWSCRLDSAGIGILKLGGYTGTICLVRRGNQCYQQGPVRNKICMGPTPARIQAFPNPLDPRQDYTELEFDGSQGDNANYTITIKREDEGC
jgi:type IV pilus modification protein PilV